MKTKNKNKVTTKKASKPSKTIKPVGKEIKTSSFGKLFYGDNVEKNIKPPNFLAIIFKKFQ